MTKHLGQISLLDLLPGSISDDPQIRAAASVLSPLLQSTARAVPNLLLYARLSGQTNLLPPLARLTAARDGLKTLSLAELELLAWQFHVDFRDVARTDAELSAMVRNSIAWHRIKGTPASIKAALALYGYSADIEESGFGENWATYQLGLPAIVDTSDLISIVKICHEMAPARCRLRRVYTSDYDIRPLILDRKFGLDRNFLDGESGIYNPDSDVVVSFGYRIRSQALPLDRTPLSAWLETCATIVDYLKRYQLDRFRLDIPLVQPITLSTSPIECAEIEAIDHAHDLSWRVGRKVSRSQLVPGWSYLDGVNSRMDRPHVIRIGNPWRVDKYRLDASIDRQIIPIHELFHSLVLHAAAERTATCLSTRSLQSLSEEIHFELHNPRHRGQRVDNVLLDSPRKERFDLADGRLQADAAPEPQRPHHMGMARTVARSQFALDASRFTSGARLDGDHVTVVLNPWLLNRYRLDESIGRTTRPVPGLGVLLSSLGTLDRVSSVPLWLDTSRVPATLLAESRQPVSTSEDTTFVLPANLPRHPGIGRITLDGVGLDSGWLHGNPFAAGSTLGGAESAPMLSERADTMPTAIVAADVAATAGECRVSPALWVSGWTSRPWIEHFSYLNTFETPEIQKEKP